MRTVSKKIGILGGGIAGLSLAYFLREKSVAVLEKEKKVGGLCRSYYAGGVAYDIGPHIMFSKNPRVLEFMTTVTPTSRLKRSNQIFLNGRYIKYPFENFLRQIRDQKVIDYCLNAFLHNPYRDMPAANMLAFFLKTFGEGITRTYLQPYNEKIWKFDPAMLDTQMVGRIPRPPDEHIIEAAKGNYHEGYLHQLHFYYPRRGGYQSMVDAVAGRVVEAGKVIVTDCPVMAVRRDRGRWLVKTGQGNFRFTKLINCMPLHALLPALGRVPPEISAAAERLLYNSIYIVIVNVKKDRIGRHFALMLPQKDVIFHRMSKLDFLGKAYHRAGSSTFMLEVTFRQNDMYDKMTGRQIINRCVADMVRLGFIQSAEHVNFTSIRKEKYAYVIYSLNHRGDTNAVLDFLRGLGIESCGRFAEFEYMNSDKVMEHSMNLAERLNSL
jgi:protoporphyrinogen oxidase